VDLGAGTGILGIAAAMLGGKVTLVEKDPDAVEITRENIEMTGVEPELLEQDISEFNENVDTVIMNPPFSVHSDEGMNFLEKAFSAANRVYLISNRSMRERIKDFAETSNHEILAVEQFKIALPATYGFHTEESRETPVDLIITQRIHNGASSS
jgi:putative methylase